MEKTVLQERLWSKNAALNVNLEESAGVGGEKQKYYYLDGIFLQGEIRNLNGRVYPLHEIKNAVDHLKEQIDTVGPVLGELDHPETLVISAHNVSHMITDIYMDGNDAKGRMKIIHDVPCGAIVEGLIKANAPIGVSSRGAGNVSDYDGEVSDFEIVTIDIVATPSAPGARPTPIYEQLKGSSRNERLLNNFENYFADPQRKFKPQLDQDLKKFIDDFTSSWRKFM